MTARGERPAGDAPPPQRPQQAGPSPTLRERAEESARGSSAGLPDALEALSPEEIARTIHELQVHQIELELQNEELRQTQVELDAARARYFDLYDLAPVGYVTVGETGLILEANFTAANLLGLPRGELAAVPLSRFILREDQDTFYTHRRQLLKTGAPEAFDLRLVTSGGATLWAHLEAAVAATPAAQPGSEGQDRRVIRVVINDITASRRLSEEKSRLEEQLRQSQKVEAIGRLAGGVAHDFNNITAIVMGYGEMLLERLGPQDPSRSHVEQIVAAGRRAATLTRQLLAVGRRQTLLPEVLDLNALLRDLDTALRRLLGEDIELEFKLAPDVGRVTADAGQLVQVVTNLVVNARDAVPKGGRLTIETADVELDGSVAPDRGSVVPGSYVQLTLTDTGCGMDQAALDRLFEPFYTTKEQGQGAGLGLATAYGIVKQSGGHIWASSEPGTGTTFRICLPRTQAPPQAKAADSSTPAARGGGELVLLAEDEAPLRKLCETLLARLGYRVSAAANGPEALRLVQEQGLAPDLLLTDVIMPRMSGAQLARSLREARPGLRVLYMSGYPDDAIAPHGVLAAGTHFLQKPFTMHALAAKLREALAGRAVAAPVSRRVLMIDDDEQYRDLARHFCTRGGHVFTGVDSAAAALAALAGSPFDVLLVDLNIPGTSGERVLREIRAAGHGAPAVVLTGDVSAADPAALRALGVRSTLEKSSDLRPLLQEIEAATRGVGH